MREDRTSDQAVAREVDGLLDAWRSKAVGLVLAVAAVTALPALVLVLSGRIFQLPWPLLILCAVLYLVVIIAALRPRLNHRGRAAVVLGVLAAFAVIQLAVTQLSGDGRLMLLILPLLAVILVGPHAGWWMAALSSVLFLGVAEAGGGNRRPQVPGGGGRPCQRSGAPESGLRAARWTVSEPDSRAAELHGLRESPRGIRRAGYGRGGAHSRGDRGIHRHGV